MSRIRQFLTPGWVLTAVLAIGFAYLAFTVLAPWQLGKNTETRERNQQITQAFDVDPVPAADLFPDDGELAEGTEWRRVTLRGEYLPDDEVLLRNRPVDGSPASHALTPFRDSDGSVYLVNRGFEVPADGGIPDMERAPAGQVDIMGYARRSELPSQTPPVEGGADEPAQVYSIHTDTIAELTDQPLHHDYVQLSEDQPGGLRAIPLPTLETGPYLAYGVQWIFFGIMAPLALVWFVVAEVRERRRDRAEQEAMLAADDGAGAGSPASLSDAARPGVRADGPAGATAASATGVSAAATGTATVERDERGARSELGGRDDLGGRPAAAGPASPAATGAAWESDSRAADSPAGPRTERPAAPGETAEEIKARRMAERYGSSGHSRFGKGKNKGERF